MKYLREYRDSETVARYLGAIRNELRGRWRIMEVCGGQTHTIVKHGLDQILPPEIELIHGPGCPVCVTPIVWIDRAIAIAERPDTILCSFGDMLRVPGSDRRDLLEARSRGADVRIVYSPLDALAMAERTPDKEIVFFAVGFETTAPANAMSVWQAARRGVTNFSILTSQVTVPAALRFLLEQEGTMIDAFLAAGHVCTIMGVAEYGPLAERYAKPIVVTGFEAVDILHGILMAVRQLERGDAKMEIAYSRSVREEGNVQAKRLLDEVFETADQDWRGLGVIPASGLRLKKTFAQFDACEKFGLLDLAASSSSDECQSGLVLQGRIKPTECPAFGTRCTPDMPLGAPMVSSEGACAAYYRYGRVAKAIL